MDATPANLMVTRPRPLASAEGETASPSIPRHNLFATASQYDNEHGGDWT